MEKLVSQTSRIGPQQQWCHHHCKMVTHWAHLYLWGGGSNRDAKSGKQDEMKSRSLITAQRMSLSIFLDSADLQISLTCNRNTTKVSDLKLSDLSINKLNYILYKLLTSAWGPKLINQSSHYTLLSLDVFTYSPSAIAARSFLLSLPYLAMASLILCIPCVPYLGDVRLSASVLCSLRGLFGALLSESCAAAQIH